MDIMFELIFPVQGHEEGGMKLKMEDVIFVMEDVDCASKVHPAQPRAETGWQLGGVWATFHPTE